MAERARAEALEVAKDVIPQLLKSAELAKRFTNPEIYFRENKNPEIYFRDLSPLNIGRNRCRENNCLTKKLS